MIRNKKFVRYLVDNCYPIAIDGTQKSVRDVLWSEQCPPASEFRNSETRLSSRWRAGLQRGVKSGDDTHMQYYVCVLEANLSFHGGMTIPLMSEFLSYTKGDTDLKKTGL